MNILDDYDRQIHDLLRKYDPLYKIEIIRVNISSTFLVRTRCSRCSKGPTYYYSIRNPISWKDARTQIAIGKWRRGWVKRMATDLYLYDEPKRYTNLQDFSFILEGKQYRPSAHRTCGRPTNNKEDITEILSCECGATTWAINQKATRNCPEITNRKGRYTYPQKFEY